MVLLAELRFVVEAYGEDFTHLSLSTYLFV